MNNGVTLITKFSATEILHALSSVANEHHRIAIDDKFAPVLIECICVGKKDEVHLRFEPASYLEGDIFFSNKRTGVKI